MWPSTAFAQSPHALVPLLTNQFPLDLPNQYGIPQNTVVNDGGDFAFIGLRGTGWYYRKAGTQAAIRAIQNGDDVPGIPGGRLNLLFTPVLMNASGVAVVRAEVFTQQRSTHAILTFDGTTLRTLVTGLDAAPGTGGAKFERAMTLYDISDAGDVLFGSTLVPLGSSVAPLPTVFKVTALGATTRIAGPGDASPGTGGVFSVATGSGINAAGQILINAVITGGSGSSGLFVWETGALRKVAAVNDPNPAGGTFSQDFTSTGQKINASGLVMFIANSSLLQNTVADGTTVAIANGSVAPAPINGTFNSITSFSALSNGGDAIVLGNVTGGAGSTGLFRFRQGTGTEVVAYLGQTAPGTGGKTFNGLSSTSVNASGTVSFQGNVTGGLQNGIFRKPAGGALVAVALSGDATPLNGIYFFVGFQTFTLSGGDTVGRVHILNAPVAHHGVFRFGAGVSTLMSTADTLPEGANEIIRPSFVHGAGAYVGIDLMKAGGREVIGYFNPTTQTANSIAVDGDFVPGLGGVLQFNTNNTVMMNSNGDAVFQASVFGGVPFVRAAILVGGATNPLTVVAHDGILDNGNRTLNNFQLNLSGVRPIAMNAAGTVVFTATSSGVRGVWVSSAANPTPFKVVLPGDLASTGEAITLINSIHGGINGPGQIVFSANTASGSGLYVVTPGSTPVKVALAGQAAPGGGTFLNFGGVPMPGFNNLGQVAFAATLTGGPGAGIYLATPNGGGGYDVAAIALNGSATPSGGTYSITIARPDVVLNDLGHVVFLSDITGGPADSGIFAKRGSSASIVTLVLQGQPAPGTASTFATFIHGQNGLIEETHQVSQTGQVAFSGRVEPPGQTQIIGWWHVELDNTIQPIIIVPSTSSAFDGGTVASAASISNWIDQDHYPMWAPLVGAPHDGGLYMYVPITGTSTGTGTNVLVHPTDDLTNTTIDVTFATVTSPGTTTLTRTASGPALPRGWYLTGLLASYYNVSTTATFTGNVTLCFDLTEFDPPNGAVFRLLHYENSAWQDITTTVNGSTLCGVSSLLGTFVPVIALNEPTSNILQNGDFSNGSASWQVFATDGTVQDNSYIQYAVNGGVFEYYRVAPPPGTSNQAVVLQDTNHAIAAGAPVVAHFDIGNSSSARKRISVLIRSIDFADLSVCTFWIPPNTPLSHYAMRTHSTIAWTGAAISFYAASANSDGGNYQLDNVVMGPGHDLTIARTDCIDPFQPGQTGSTTGANIIQNGDFSNAFTSWSTVGTSDGRLTAQVSGGVAQFIRPSAPANQPSGVIVQPTGVAVGALQVVSATFRLGNSSSARKRVTVLIHDFFFGDLAACTFWLPAGQPLMDYSMRTFTTQAWTNAAISFYPATTDSLQWFLLDDVTLKATPASQTYGSDCVEPQDTSGLSGSSPAPEPASWLPASIELTGAQPAELPAWVGMIAVDRRRLI